MTVLFVAGAGTDVGKTHVCALLARALRAGGRSVLALKPVASGVPAWDDPAFARSDTAVLLAAQGLALTEEAVDACTPWRFAAPLAPDMAALREGRSLHLAELAAFHVETVARAPGIDAVLVEGAGGVMSPITRDALCLDWIRALEAPTLLVAGSYLGAISHALTACETLARHGLPLLAVVVSESADSPVPLEETAHAIQRRTPAPVCVLPRSAPPPVADSPGFSP